MLFRSLLAFQRIFFDFYRNTDYTANDADATFGALVTASATTGVLTITPTVATTPISVGVQAGYCSLEATSTETPTDTYEACKDEDSSFFWVSCQDHDKTKQQTLATAVSADKKIFPYSTEDSACLSKADTTNIGYLLKSASLDWACGMYHEHANLHFPEGAIVGAAAGTDFDNYGPDSDRKSTRLNSSHEIPSRMPSSA